MKLRTPEKARAISHLASVRVAKDKESVPQGVQVSVSYAIKSLVAFPQSMFVHSFSESTTAVQFSIPIIASESCDLSKLQITATKELEFLSIAVERTSAVTGKLNCRGMMQAANGNLFGEIKLRDPETGYTDSIICNLERQNAVEVFPKPIRFTEGEKGQLEASFVLKINAATSTEARVASQKEISVTASVNGAKVKTNVVEIREGVARVTLIATDFEDAKSFLENSKEDGVILFIAYRGREFATKCKLIFIPRE